jgi:predicted thioredoxin/glutaredoxin
MTDKDWEAKFEMLFKEDLIDLPEDFFDEELFYTDPNDLNNIFSELEEKNLYLIHMSQEVE